MPAKPSSSSSNAPARSSAASRVNAHHESRLNRYERLSAALAAMSDGALRAKLDAAPSTQGWGRSQVIKVGRDRVFVKRVPLTDKELLHPYSTRNHFRLPLFYNYGVGSAGFGAYRELRTHQRATEWVLGGESENFPLMFHHRIIMCGSQRAGKHAVDAHVRYWNGSKRIGAFMQARGNASHELLVFIEHFPLTVARWASKSEARAHWVDDEMSSAVRHLRRKRVIHFDGHSQNIVTDGVRAYLTDFGLALDRSFELTDSEVAFYKRHTGYDRAYNAATLGYFATVRLCQLRGRRARELAQRYGIESRVDAASLLATLVHLDDIIADGLLRESPEHLTRLHALRPVALLMHRFFADIRRSAKKDTTFDNARVRRLLRSRAR